MFRLLRRAYGAYSTQIAALAALGFLGGLLEGIGINAVVPLLTFIFTESAQAFDPISNILRSVFTFIGIDFAPKYLLAFIVIMFLARAAVMYALSYIQTVISFNYERDTRVRVFETLLRSSWSHHLARKFGHLETIIMIDAPASTNLLRKLSNLITLATGLIMYLIVAFNISPAVTFLTFAVGVCGLLFFRYFLTMIHARSSERVALNKEVAHYMGEYAAGAKAIKASGTEEVVAESGVDLFSRLRNISVSISLVQQVAVLIIPPAGILYIALIFGVAYRTDFIQLAALPAIIYLIYRISLYAQQGQDHLQGIQELVPHLQSVLAFEEKSRQKEEHIGGDKLFAFHKELRFDDVHFSYDDGREALKGVSFTVKGRSTVGIVGPSGAGKTTSVDLMLRLLEPTNGAITLDGVNVRDISLQSWRAKTGYVPQEPFLLHDTIRNNVLFQFKGNGGQDALSDADVWHFLKMADAEDFVRAMPEGLDSMVGDRGVTLSAGQRQRLVIARELARKPELLILDEATSALDSESEARLQKVIQKLKGSVTIVIIAHRLSTILESDKLVVLKEGTVAEPIASPEAMLRTAGSYLSHIFSLNKSL
ncbi:MAG: ATP-binding cassette, subfamily C, bacterial [Parcubacteria group bacterium Gr01-1014_8]|nr:MAG: ATP-binding cassette, subfamily C, bacterial [Parcubacteria group bacterium Gr01-1014_8]